MEVGKVSNGKSDFQGHSRALAMVPFDTLPLFRTTVGGDPVGILPVPGLSYGVVCVILCLSIFVELRLVTDRQTNRQTDT